MRRRLMLFSLPCLVSIAWNSADGATFRVPQEYPTIAEAANLAQKGDSILVWRPPGGDYVGEQINLRQGVVLRGMEQIYPSVDMRLYGCTINMIEAASVPGEDDTTRVEHFYMSPYAFSMAVEMYTPRGRLERCGLFDHGPQDYPAVRVWNGGLVIGNEFRGPGETCGIRIRQGDVVVAWNCFESMFINFALDNRYAPGLVDLSFRHNSLYDGFQEITMRVGSQAELVNNIFWGSGTVCYGYTSIDIRYNDLFQTGGACPLGKGNIDAFPQYCEPPPGVWGFWLPPESPCVGAGENGATMGAGGICGVTALPEERALEPRLRLSIIPNPVWSSAEFHLEGTVLPEALEIYDPQGRLVDLISPVANLVRWTPRAADPRGVYFVRVRGKGVSEVAKFLLIR